jgi:kynurenine 3-monooxygenase
VCFPGHNPRELQAANRRLVGRMYYEQTYISTMWCEFTIPPHPETGDFQLSPNHLHIWPKQTQMFIAIPSIDKSFTSTLFMPDAFFDSIKTRADLISFFKEHYADVLQILGEDSLCDQYFNNEHLPLVSIRTGPYHYSDRCVIVGDAAHAMVPFYGQGMNAGFESVNVLFKHIRAHPQDLKAALDAYTAERQPDAWAIVELAMRNYDEMRSGVTKRGYLLRKWVEEACAKWVPQLGVKTLYSMVSFGNERYSEVLKKAERQMRAEERVLGAAVVAVLAGVGWRAGVWRALGVGCREGFKALTRR